MKLTRKILIGASATLMALSLAGCGSQNNATGTNTSTDTNSSVQSAKSASPKLADSNYKSGQNAWINVNNDHSTLNPKSWKYDHVVYNNLDGENRSSTGNTAYLDKNNIANEGQRTRQIVKPTGWHQKFVNGSPIINRGHEIAYSLSGGINQKGEYQSGQTSGDQNNPKNLFTQTAFSNQKVQTIYESKVRNALKAGDKVIFQVTPVFRGRDLMAKGVHMQAISTNQKLNFNVYLYNVQPGMSFNYATGRSTVDRAMQVPTPKNAPNFHDNNGSTGNSTYNSGYPRTRVHRHHWVRDYVGYRIGKHMIKRHYAKHYARRYARRGFVHHRL